MTKARLSFSSCAKRLAHQVADAPDAALIYADPPYLDEVRTATATYTHELDVGDHPELAEALRSICYRLYQGWEVAWRRSASYGGAGRPAGTARMGGGGSARGHRYEVFPVSETRTLNAVEGRLLADDYDGPTLVRWFRRLDEVCEQLGDESPRRVEAAPGRDAAHERRASRSALSLGPADREYMRDPIVVLGYHAAGDVELLDGRHRVAAALCGRRNDAAGLCGFRPANGYHPPAAQPHCVRGCTRRLSPPKPRGSRNADRIPHRTLT